MSASHLVVVSSPDEPDSESAGQKIRRLRDEAKTLAREQVEQLSAALADVRRLADDIVEGGDLYPVGAREVARRLAEDAARQSLTLSAILERA